MPPNENNFNFGMQFEDGLNQTDPINPIGGPVSSLTPPPATTQQLTFPLDSTSKDIIQNVVESFWKQFYRVQSLTLKSGDVTFAVMNSDRMSVSSPAAVSITTITNGYNGQILTLIFNDSNITIVNNSTGAANTINLGGVNITGSDNTTLELIFDGTSWYINTASFLAAVGGRLGGFTIDATTLTATNLIINTTDQTISVGALPNTITINGATGVISSSGTGWSLDGSGAITNMNRISIVSTNVTINNTVTETNLISVTVPANVLGTTGAVRVRMYITGFTKADVNSDSFRFKYGATTLITKSDSDFANTTAHIGYIEFVLASAGATNSQTGDAIGWWSQPQDTLSSTGTHYLFNSAGTSAIDSTADQTLVISFQWGVANAGNSITMTSAVIEKIS